MATQMNNGLDMTSNEKRSSEKPPTISTGQNLRDQLWIEVVDFLKTMKLDEYIDVFQSEGFDSLESLNTIDMSDLRDMKVKKGHAKLLLHKIEQMKSQTMSPGKRVRFGGTPTPSSILAESINVPSPDNKYPGSNSNLPIVDETKTIHNNDKPHHPYNSGSQNNFSGSQSFLIQIDEEPIQPNPTYHHSAIRPRGNTYTPTNNIQVPRQNSSRVPLLRSQSVRSDKSAESEEPHSPRTFHRARSYDHDHSPGPSFSDAGTVVIRGSVHDDRSVYTHTPYQSYNNPVASPVMPPICMDMHHDLNVLIDELQRANCVNNVHFDEYHEALVNVTSCWDRDRCERDLKYISSKGNYMNYVVLDLLGVLNAQLGNTDVAIKYHTDAIRASDNQYTEAMHNYAYLLHRIGDKDNDLLSVKYYKMALSINGSFAHCWLHYGNLLEDDGKLKEAAAMYKKAISIRPTNAAFHLDLANVLDDLNQFDEASEQYQKCIELQPNDPVYHWNYAISLENQCFYHKASEAYKRAINLEFNCVDAHINYAHMLENQPSPQYKKALDEYEIILKIPEMMHNTEIMFKCAKLYQHFGDTEKTEKMYMNILQIEPGIEDTYILFAKYLTDQNRIEDANACYQAGIRQVQTPKLQEQYIRFLKDINELYNNRNGKSKNGVKRNGITRIKSTATPITNGSKQYVPPSPFMSSMKPTDIDDVDAADYDLQYDYYKPAKRESNISNISNISKKNNDRHNANTNGKTVTANGDDPGCIVM